MNAVPPPDEEAWLAQFFSGKNLLTWDGIQAGSAPDGWAGDVRPWIDLVVRADPDLPIVLPFMEKADQVIWYGIARDPQTAIRLGQELLAMLGPSYTNFTGLPHVLDIADIQEAALATHCVAPAYRLVPTEASYLPRIRGMVELYRGVLERRPPRPPPAARPIGSIRKDFDRALLADDEDQAERSFEELLQTGRLSAENRVFLEVRLLAGLSRWPQIAGNHTLLRNLSDLPLPPQVLVDTVEAIYRVHVESFEADGDVAGAIESFAEKIATRYGRLFGTRRGLRRPRILKAFFLYELCQPVPDPSICSDIGTLLSGFAAEPFVAGLLAAVPNRATADPPAVAAPAWDLAAAADEAFEDDQHDRALAIYRTLPVTPKTLRRMLRCAREIGSAGAAGDVLQIVASAPPEIVGGLTASARETLDQLRVLSTPIAPSASTAGIGAGQDLGWVAWARWVIGGAPVSAAERVAREWAPMWDVNAVSGDQEAVNELAQLIGNAEGLAADVFRAVFPALFEAFVVQPDGASQVLKPLYAMLLTVLALGDSNSPDDLELARQLAEVLLLCGNNRVEYRAMVQDLEELLGEAPSINTLPWALDTAEVLAINPAPDSESRLRFFMKVLEFAQTTSHRVTVAHRTALGLLCMDFGVEFPSNLSDADSTGTHPARTFTGKRVSIYTLTEPAGKRAADMLRQTCPGLEVDINSDEVCTDRLGALAKNSDIFIFAWRSSKHQAYYCIKNNRPATLPLLQPLGKGSASILRAALEYLT
jgi:hypothetical protein